MAILIAFSYFEANDDSLVGAYVDLYQVYRYCISIGIERADIYVVTDFSKDISSGLLLPLIADDIIDVDIGTFLKELRSTGRHIHYEPLRLFDMLRKINIISKRLLVYFSGHGICPSGSCSYFKMPDGTSIPVEAFHSEIRKISTTVQSYLFIYDCCHLYPTDLPYRYMHGKGRGYFCLIHPNMIKKTNEDYDTICLCASDQNNKAQSTIYGSLFTRHLILALRKKIRFFEDISSILQKAGVKNFVIWSNSSLYTYLRAWIVGLEDLIVKYDDSISCVRVTLT